MKKLRDYLHSKDKNVLLIRHDCLNFDVKKYLNDSGYENLVYIDLGQDSSQIGKQVDNLQLKINVQVEQEKSLLILDNYDATLNLRFFRSLEITAHPRLKIIIICKASFLELEGPYKSYINQIIPDIFLDRGLKQLQEMTIPLLTADEIYHSVEISISQVSHWKVEHYQNLFHSLPELMDLAKYPKLLELIIIQGPIYLGAPKENYKRSDGYRLCEYLLVQWFSLSIDCLERSGQLVVSRSETEKDSWEFAEAVAGCLHEDRRQDEVIEIGERWNPLLNGEWCVDRESGWKRLRVAKQVCPWIVVEEGELKFISAFVQKMLYKKKQSKYASHIGRKNRLLLDDMKLFEINQEEKIGKDPLNQKIITRDEVALQLEVDNLRKNLEKRLNELKTLVELSRYSEKYAIGALNAVTVMNLAGVNFSGWNLSRVKLSVSNDGKREGANVSGGYFLKTDFNHADLRNTNFTKSMLFGSDLSYADLDGLYFAELPSIVHPSADVTIKFVNFIDHLNLLVIVYMNFISLFDYTTNSIIAEYPYEVCCKYQFPPNYKSYKSSDTVEMCSISLSSEMKYIVCGFDNGSVLIWDMVTFELIKTLGDPNRKNIRIKKDDSWLSSPVHMKVLFHSTKNLLIFAELKRYQATSQTLFVFNISSNNVNELFYSSYITAFDVCSSKNIAVAGYENGEIIFWDLVNQLQTKRFLVEGSIKSVYLNGDLCHMAILIDRAILVYDEYGHKMKSRSLLNDQKNVFIVGEGEGEYIITTEWSCVKIRRFVDLECIYKYPPQEDRGGIECSVSKLNKVIFVTHYMCRKIKVASIANEGLQLKRFGHKAQIQSLNIGNIDNRQCIISGDWENDYFDGDGFYNLTIRPTKNGIISHIGNIYCWDIESGASLLRARGGKF